MIRFYSRFCALVLIVSSVQAHAAMEYFRFEGRVFTEENLYWCDCYNPDLGLVAEQPLYFDFAVDVDAEPPENPGGFGDYFYVEYLGGTLSEPQITSGQTRNFPEGSISFLSIGNGIFPAVGTIFDEDQFTGRTIDFWDVGYIVYLLNNNHYNGPMGLLEVTYRGPTAPPAIVPLPSAIWLSLIAVASLLGVTRRR